MTEGTASGRTEAGEALERFTDEPEWRHWRTPPEDPTVRMFERDWMEKFSRVHPLVPHAIFLPVIGFMIWRSLAIGLSGMETLGLFVAGLLAWTVVEVGLHRFVFHEISTEETERSVKRKVHSLDPDEPVMRHLDGWREKFYFVAHGVHHEFPSDPRRLVMPPSVSVPLAVVFWVAFEALLGSALAPASFAGFVLGYLIYDSFHYAIHFIRPGGRVEAAMYLLGKGHMRHHFADNRKDYGVSSPLWDLVFGTFNEEETSQFRPGRPRERRRRAGDSSGD